MRRTDGRGATDVCPPHCLISMLCRTVVLWSKKIHHKCTIQQLHIPTLNMQNEYKFLSSTFLRSLYNEPLTPSSNPSLSPGGSPLREGPLERSTLPSPADWSEFINASNSKVERDLAQLTLSDPEQRELYEAARLVQTAFRKYKVQARRSGAICCVYCSPQ